MISYIGGKSSISKSLIIPNIPKDIEVYCEPFSGMMWVFFRMDIDKYPNLKKIVYNDVNPLNVNLFLCVKDYKKLWDMTAGMPVENKELFDKYKFDVFNTDFKLDMNKPNFEIAYKYAYILSLVWSGTDPRRGKLVMKGGYVDKNGDYKSKYETFRSKLVNKKWQKLFESITNLENMDFEDVINKYDSPTSYFYCDPPYYLTEKYYTNHDFGLETHERLANFLKDIKGKFSLSYYDFPQLSEWFPKDKYNWISKDFNKAAAAKSGKEQPKGTELLVMNY